MGFPKILLADEGCDVLKNGDGSFYAVLCSESPTTSPAHVAEIARRWNACAGIDTAHLWPGAMEEMVEALEKLHHDIRDLMAESGGVYGLHRNGDDAPWDTITGNGRFQEWLGPALDNTRAILAKLGKV